MRRIALLAAALAVTACAPEFPPASLVDKLRVVAIQAEPPEIDPSGVATLTSLVLRPDYATSPARTTTIVHLACVPVPGSPDPTPCVALANLVDPAAEIAARAGEACAPPPAGAPVPPWAPIDLVGIEACTAAGCAPARIGGLPVLPPRLTAPAGLAGRLAAAGPERVFGVQAVVLSFALDATPDELVAGVGTCPAADLGANLAALWDRREHVLSLKRVVIRGPDPVDAAANRNPAVDGILAGATTLDPSVATTLAPGEYGLAPIRAAGPAGQPEVYTRVDAAGVPYETATEEWVYSWFATQGELKKLHTRSESATDTWKFGARGPVRVVVVVRDLRGGTAWAVRDVVFGP